MCLTGNAVDFASAWTTSRLLPSQNAVRRRGSALSPSLLLGARARTRQRQPADPSGLLSSTTGGRARAPARCCFRLRALGKLIMTQPSWASQVRNKHTELGESSRTCH